MVEKARHGAVSFASSSAINRSKRQIAALHKQFRTGQETEERDDNEQSNEAGDQFGRKRSKKNKN